MAAIYKRELKFFFHTFIGWLFVASMLFMMGIYFTVFNVYAGYPTISYVFQSMVFLFLIAIPVLTMRVFAEERKYKTDQLILTAPVSVGEIVMGKYLALVTVFAIPTAVIGITPLFLRSAGTFQTGLSYVSLLGFFLYGCLGLAIGLFVSSLTESVVISAVLTFTALFLGYIMSGLCGILSGFGTTDFIKYVTKFLFCFDMVGRFDSLSGGYFQAECVVYYISFTAFVLFCTVWSIRKRRYAAPGRRSLSSVFGVGLAAVLAVAVNLILNYVPDRYLSLDVTANKMYTLTEDTRQFLRQLDQDITIYVLADEASKDSDLDKTLRQFRELSEHITVEYMNPAANPMFYYKYTDTQPSGNSLIVEGPYDDVVIDYGDIYAYEFNYATYQSELAGYDGEGQIVSALARVSSDDLPKFYVVTGHGELAFDERFLNAMEKENVTYEEISLHQVDAIPEDAAGIILNAPTSDYSKEDADKVLSYLDQGHNALIVPTWTEESMENFERIMEFYGVSVVDGMVVEKDRNYYYQIPYFLFPEIVYDDVTQKVSDGVVFAPLSRGLLFDEDNADVFYRPLLKTSDSAFSKTDPSGGDNYEKDVSDIDGPFVIAMGAEKSLGNETVSKAMIVASEQIFTASADDVVPGYNVRLFCSMLSSLMDRESSISVPVKYYDIGNLAFSARTLSIVAVVSVIVLPAGCLVAGFVIWLRRRKR